MTIINFNRGHGTLRVSIKINKWRGRHRWGDAAARRAATSSGRRWRGRPARSQETAGVTRQLRVPVGGAAPDGGHGAAARDSVGAPARAATAVGGTWPGSTRTSQRAGAALRCNGMKAAAASDESLGTRLGQRAPERERETMACRSGDVLMARWAAWHGQRSATWSPALASRASGASGSAAEAVALGRMTSGSRPFDNFQGFSNAQTQNSKQAPSWSPKLLINSELIEKVKGNNFTCWSNFKIETCF
jgi:hypothetical protein